MPLMYDITLIMFFATSRSHVAIQPEVLFTQYISYFSDGVIRTASDDSCGGGLGTRLEYS